MEMLACSSPKAEEPVVALPLSKSEAARVLVASFWSGDCLDCLCLPQAADTQDLLKALRGLRAGDDSFYLGEGAASLRFFLAAGASLPGAMMRIDCGETLRRRPMKILIEALNALGGNIKSDGGCAPFLVGGRRITGGDISIDASVSSQFISSLMLSAPMWRRGLRLRYADPRAGVVSRPYIDLTAAVMRGFGVDVVLTDEEVCVSPGGYSAVGPVEIEADWSAASYYYEYVLTGRRSCRLRGLVPFGKSLQGDSACEGRMEEIGVITEWTSDGDARLFADEARMEKARQTGVDWNLKDTPDLVPAFAVGCCMAKIPFVFREIGHLRYKETDRLHALAQELGKLGYRISVDGDSLSWRGECSPAGRDVSISTYSDHRMAMAFGAVAQAQEMYTVEDMTVVGKSYPSFRRDINRLKESESNA